MLKRILKEEIMKILKETELPFNRNNRLELEKKRGDENQNIELLREAIYSLDYGKLFKIYTKYNRGPTLKFFKQFKDFEEGDQVEIFDSIVGHDLFFQYFVSHIESILKILKPNNDIGKLIQSKISNFHAILKVYSDVTSKSFSVLENHKKDFLFIEDVSTVNDSEGFYDVFYVPHILNDLQLSDITSEHSSFETSKIAVETWLEYYQILNY